MNRTENVPSYVWGNCAGHLAPGIMCCAQSIWWIISIFRRQRQSFAAKRDFRSSAFYPAKIYNQLYPLESFLKMACLSTMNLVVACGNIHALGYLEPMNYQHVSIFTFYIVEAITEISLFYGCVVLGGADYLAAIFSSSLQALIFYFHLQGRGSSEDIQCHVLLFFCVLGTTTAFLLELKFRNCLLLTLCRAYFRLLTGLWLIGIGILLYSPFNSLSYIADAHVTDISHVNFYFGLLIVISAAFVVLIGDKER